MMASYQRSLMRTNHHRREVDSRHRQPLLPRNHRCVTDELHSSAATDDSSSLILPSKLRSGRIVCGRSPSQEAALLQALGVIKAPEYPAVGDVFQLAVDEFAMNMEKLSVYYGRASTTVGSPRRPCELRFRCQCQVDCSFFIQSREKVTDDDRSSLEIVASRPHSCSEKDHLHSNLCGAELLEQLLRDEALPQSTNSACIDSFLLRVKKRFNIDFSCPQRRESILALLSHHETPAKSERMTPLHAIDLRSRTVSPATILQIDDAIQGQQQHEHHPKEAPPALTRRPTKKLRSVSPCSRHVAAATVDDVEVVAAVKRSPRGKRETLRFSSTEPREQLLGHSSKVPLERPAETAELTTRRSRRALGTSVAKAVVDSTERCAPHDHTANAVASTKRCAMHEHRLETAQRRSARLGGESGHEQNDELTKNNTLSPARRKIVSEDEHPASQTQRQSARSKSAQLQASLLPQNGMPTIPDLAMDETTSHAPQPRRSSRLEGCGVDSDLNQSQKQRRSTRLKSLQSNEPLRERAIATLPNLSTNVPQSLLSMPRRSSRLQGLGAETELTELPQQPHSATEKSNSDDDEEKLPSPPQEAKPRCRGRLQDAEQFAADRHGTEFEGSLAHSVESLRKHNASKLRPTQHRFSSRVINESAESNISNGAKHLTTEIRHAVKPARESRARATKRCSTRSLVECEEASVERESAVTEHFESSRRRSARLKGDSVVDDTGAAKMTRQLSAPQTESSKQQELEPVSSHSVTQQEREKTGRRFSTTREVVDTKKFDPPRRRCNVRQRGVSLGDTLPTELGSVDAVAPLGMSTQMAAHDPPRHVRCVRFDTQEASLESGQVSTVQTRRGSALRELNRGQPMSAPLPENLSASSTGPEMADEQPLACFRLRRRRASLQPGPLQPHAEQDNAGLLSERKLSLRRSLRRRRGTAGELKSTQEHDQVVKQETASELAQADVTEVSEVSGLKRKSGPDIRVLVRYGSHRYSVARHQHVETLAATLPAAFAFGTVAVRGSDIRQTATKRTAEAVLARGAKRRRISGCADVGDSYTPESSSASESEDETVPVSLQSDPMFVAIVRKYEELVLLDVCEPCDFGWSVQTAREAIDAKLEELSLRPHKDSAKDDAEVGAELREFKKSLRELRLGEDREKLALLREKDEDVSIRRRWDYMSRGRRKKTPVAVEEAKFAARPVQYVGDREWNRAGTRHCSLGNDCRLCNPDGCMNATASPARLLLAPRVKPFNLLDVCGTDGSSRRSPRALRSVSSKCKVLATTLALNDAKHSLAFVEEYKGVAFAF